MEERIDCQYCQDIGPCRYCKRGQEAIENEKRKMRLVKRRKLRKIKVG